MTFLSVLLIAIGAADIMRVLLPHRWGASARLLSLAVLFLAVLTAAGLVFSVPWWLLPWGLLPVLCWLAALRIGAPLPVNSLAASSARQSLLIIGFLLSTAALTAADYRLGAGVDHHTLPLLAAGLLLFLTVSANGLVRAALRQDGPGEQPAPAEGSQLKGGRWIGPLERITLTGLLVTGAYPVAAGLIAAKGIVRFPEIQADQKNGNKAEYFLVGSFVSWTVAMAAAGLLYLTSLTAGVSLP